MALNRFLKIDGFQFQSEKKTWRTTNVVLACYSALRQPACWLETSSSLKLDHVSSIYKLNVFEIYNLEEAPTEVTAIHTVSNGEET